MSFELPQIKYPSAVIGGGQTTLQLHRQFRRVPAYDMVAVRHDNTASSGVREVVLERVQNFFEGDLEYIAIGDVAGWQTFLASALQGVPFDLYLNPVSAPSTYTTYYLEDTTWRPDWQAAGQYKFKMKFYQYVAWP